MSIIQLTGSLQPGSVDTPLDARSRIATLADVPNIQLPFVGMVFYVVATGKRYLVRSLTAKTIGGATVANAAIDQYEELGTIDLAALDERYMPKGAVGAAAAITLPVPFDDNDDNVSLVVDFCENPNFADGEFTRLSMAVWYARMMVFDGNKYAALTEQSLGVPDYGRSVSFVLDNEMFPGYVPGNLYYGRYSWIDSKGGYSDWKGFRLRGDVSDFEPIHAARTGPWVKAETTLSGTPTLDYLAGEIQNYVMTSDVTINLANVNNLPFAEALIVNVRRTSGTLTVTADGRSQTYAESKTYMVIISNFGALNIAVTETI